jgi:hypothetical protein
MRFVLLELGSRVVDQNSVASAPGRLKFGRLFLVVLHEKTLRGIKSVGCEEVSSAYCV